MSVPSSARPAPGFRPRSRSSGEDGGPSRSAASGQALVGAASQLAGYAVGLLSGSAAPPATLPPADGLFGPAGAAALLSADHADSPGRAEGEGAGLGDCVGEAARDVHDSLAQVARALGSPAAGPEPEAPLLAQLEAALEAVGLLRETALAADLGRAQQRPLALSPARQAVAADLAAATDQVVAHETALRALLAPDASARVPLLLPPVLTHPPSSPSPPQPSPFHRT